jgi:RNA polymerase sigma factor (sigma-70 family)
MNSGHVPLLIQHLHRLTQRGTGEETDRQLLERFTRRRDEAAFAALVHRHAALVYGVGRRLLGHAQDAEDIFQATFLVLARKAGMVRWHDSAAAWLYDVSRRLAFKARADRQRRLEQERRAADRPCAECNPDLARRELCSLLDEEVHRLPDHYRLPVLLCYFEGQTSDQAARALGWALRTLERRLGRARVLLRERLTRRGVAFPAALLVTSLSRQSADAGLLHSAVRAAMVGTAPISPEVAALVAAGLASVRAGKARFVAAVGLAVCLLTGSLTLLAGQAIDTSPASWQNPPLAHPAKSNRTDTHGDPLPSEAVLRLGGLRFRHGAVLEHLAYAPDGKTLASAGGGDVHVWETATGRRLHHFQGERDTTGFVTRLAFSPDGKTLARATLGNKITLWEMATGKPLWHREAAAFFFLPDGKTLLTGGTLRLNRGPRNDGDQQDEEKIRAWTVPGGYELTPAVIRARGWPLALSVDGKQLATLTGGVPVLFSLLGRPATKGQVLRVWDTATGKELHRGTVRYGHVEAAAFSPAGLTVLSRENPQGLKDASLRLWDLVNSGKPRTLTGESQWVLFSHFSADGRRLVASGYDSGLRIWDTATGEVLCRLKGPVDGVLRGSAFSPDGKTLAAGGEGWVVQFWDAASGAEREIVSGHPGRVALAALSRDGKQVLSAGFDHTVRVWDAATGAPLRRWDKPGAALTHAAFSLADGLAAASSQGEVSLWYPETGRERFLGKSDLTWEGLALSPDGKFLAGVGTRPGANAETLVWLWDVAAGKELWKVPSRHLFYSQAVGFSPDGRVLATTGGEGVVRFWEPATGQLLRTFPENVVPTVANALALVFVFSPDGRTLLTSQGQRLRLWEAATGKLRFDLPEAAPRQGCVAWSPDGRWAVTGTPDGTVRLWEPLTGRERHRFTGHRGAVMSLAFSADGRTLVSASVDSTVLVWTIPSLRPTHAAGTTDLSAEELAQLWDDLKGDDAERAYRATKRLVSGTGTVAFLVRRLRPAAAIEEQRLAALLKGLKSDRLALRQKATQEAEKLGNSAEPVLREVLNGKPALEVRLRIEWLLARIATPAGEQLRALRAVEVLEHVGDPLARQLLERLAKGEPDARLTREARASLQRLDRRRNVLPEAK